MEGRGEAREKETEGASTAETRGEGTRERGEDGRGEGRTAKKNNRVGERESEMLQCEGGEEWKWGGGGVEVGRREEEEEKEKRRDCLRHLLY